MSAAYRITSRPEISLDEVRALDAAEEQGTFGAACGKIRPETLGYQHCWRLRHHQGAHLAQDGRAWHEVHKVKAVKGEAIPGTWVGICSCGWRGMVHGSKGARAAAVADAYSHEVAAAFAPHST